MEKKPCEYAGGSCYEMPDVGCDYHGEEALKNKTGYYAVTPMPNKEPTKTCTNIDCPERTGGECNAGPTKEWETTEQEKEYDVVLEVIRRSYRED